MFRPVLVGIAFAIAFASSALAQQIIGGGGGVQPPAVSPTSAYGTGVSLCVPTYSAVTYQWQRDGTPIGGETSACHTTVTADGGHSLAPTILPTAVPVTGTLTIAGTPVTTGQLNVAYTGFTVSSGGGYAPVAFTLNTGTWPTGITLNSSTGVVSGTPTVAGSFTGLVIRATDAQLHTADLPSFDLTISNYQPVGFLINPATTFGVLAATPGFNGGVDTKHFVAAWWQKGNVGISGTSAAQTVGQAEGWNYYLGDYLSNYCSGAGTSSENCQGMNNVPDNAGSGANALGTLRVNVAAAGATDAIPLSFGVQYNNILPALNAGWHRYVELADVDLASARVAVYIDGVKQTISASSTNTLAGGAINFNSANGWRLASRDNATIHAMSFEMADVFVDTKTATPTGCSGWGGGGGAVDLLDSSGNACPALLTALGGSTPTDPGTGCVNFTGYSDVCIKADATTAVLTNSGSATGTFALANPLSGGTDTAKAFRSPVDPGANGAPTDVPYPLWWHSAHSTGSLTSVTGFTGDGVIENQGNPIVAGNFMILGVVTVEGSGSTTRNPSCSTNGIAWTRIVYQEQAGDRSLSVFTRTADANDVAAAGANAANPPVCTWTAGATLRGAEYNWTVFGGSNTIAVQTTGTPDWPSGNQIAIKPAVVTSTGATELVSIYMTYSHTDTVAPQAQGTRLAFPPATGAGAWPHLGVNVLRLTNGQTAGPAAGPPTPTYSTDVSTTSDHVGGVNITLAK